MGDADELEFLEQGDIVGDYCVEKLIGIGGMGMVAAATHVDTGKRVALKVMLPKVTADENLRRRFIREARAASRIESRHIAHVFDVGEADNGAPFMALELLDGKTLSDVIRDRAPLELEEAVDYLLQACAGVAAAHARGIVHRDIKPSNLFLIEDDDAPLLKVLDFGISKIGELDQETGGTALTETNALLGSPQYMSPEQLRSAKTVDARSDIWALGLTLHKMLTGYMAFEADNLGAHFAMIMTDPPTPVRERRPDISAELERVILGCLQRDVTRRFQDVGQLARALAPFGPPQAEAVAASIETVLKDAGVRAETSPRSVRPRRFGEQTGDEDVTQAADPVVQDVIGDLESQDTVASDETSGLGDSQSTEARSTHTLTAAAGAQKGHPARLAVAAVVVVGMAFGGYRLLRSQPRSIGTTQSAELGQTSVSLRLALTPPDATVKLDGRVVAENPIVMPHTEREHRIEVSAPGYDSVVRVVTAQRDADLMLALPKTEVENTANTPPSPAESSTVVPLTPPRPATGPAVAATREEPAPESTPTASPKSAATPPPPPSVEAKGPMESTL